MIEDEIEEFYKNAEYECVKAYRVMEKKTVIILSIFHGIEIVIMRHSGYIDNIKFRNLNK